MAVAALFYAGIIIGGSFAGDWIARALQITIYPHNEPTFHKIITLALVGYVFLTAIPFVPGIEVGLGLIIAFGPPIVPVVYVATVLALTLSYSIGRLVPDRWIAAAFGRMGFVRAQRMVNELASMSSESRVDLIIGRAPKRWIPLLLRYRFLALAILINLPGSALIGGGGGICMVVGLSRLVSFPQFVLTVVVAVSPLPIAILIASSLGRTIVG